MRTLCLLAGVLIAAVSVGRTDPRIEIPEPSFNFGKTVRHAKMRHTFWIKSVGDEPVRIKKVVPGCSCTKAPLPDSVIAPGDSVPLTIIFDSKSFRGNVVRKPYFVTDYDTEPRYVSIYAEMLNRPEKATPLVISPPRVDILQVGDKPRRKASFSIINVTDRDYKMTLVGNGFESFTLDFPDVIKANDTATVRLKIREDRLDTEFAESITFELDDDYGTRYTVPVRKFERKAAAQRGQPGGR